MGKTAHLLPHRGFIKSETKVYNDIGGWTKTFTLGTIAHKVRIEVKKGELKTEDPGALKEYSHLVSSETSFNEGAIIVWDSVEFRVVRQHKPFDMRKLHHYLYFIQQLR